ncbi:hypothetical protein KC336_g39 [Hortaea werneckii]|nr:hypothetical protein KC336_g39 [Hortaea werneckii]
MATTRLMGGFPLYRAKSAAIDQEQQHLTCQFATRLTPHNPRSGQTHRKYFCLPPSLWVGQNWIKIITHPARSDDGRPLCLVRGGSVPHLQDTSLASKVRYDLACSYNEYAQLRLAARSRKQVVVTRRGTGHKPLGSRPPVPFICAVRLRSGLDHFANMHLAPYAYFARETWRVTRCAHLHTTVPTFLTSFTIACLLIVFTDPAVQRYLESLRCLLIFFITLRVSKLAGREMSSLRGASSSGSEDTWSAPPTTPLTGGLGSTPQPSDSESDPELDGESPITSSLPSSEQGTPSHRYPKRTFRSYTVEREVDSVVDKFGRRVKLQWATKPFPTKFIKRQAQYLRIVMETLFAGSTLLTAGSRKVILIPRRLLTQVRSLKVPTCVQGYEDSFDVPPEQRG